MQSQEAGGAHALHAVAEFDAIESERKRVAKELHDEVLPALARLTRFVQSQSQYASSTRLTNELHQAIAIVRDLLAELHPVDLEELGLVAALHNLCLRYTRFTGRCLVFIEKEEEVELSQRQQLYLYRAAQAAVKMFAASDNDILLLSCYEEDEIVMVSIHCVDKQVKSSDWHMKPALEAQIFRSCCELANAKVSSGTHMIGDFPLDILIATSANKDALQHSNKISNPDHLRQERLLISKQVNQKLVPVLQNIVGDCIYINDEAFGWELTQRIAGIQESITSVLEEKEPLCMSQESLIPSLSTLVDQFNAESKIKTELILDLPFIKIALQANTRFALFRVAQEALHNIEKHSQASLARISLRESAGIIHICIEDNGRGFKRSKNVHSRGLKNIKERAAAIGATVNWSNAVSFPTGTMLAITLDLNSVHKFQAELVFIG